MSGLEPANECSLLRLVWSPRCFDANRLTTACFDSADLLPKKDANGNDKFVSSDCEAEIDKAAVDARIARQTRGDLRKQEGRHDARFVRLLCVELRRLPERGDPNSHPLRVERSPTPAVPEIGYPENPAHCAIRNVSPNSRTTDKAANRVYVEYLRKELLKLVRADLGYAEIFLGAVD